MLFNILLLSLNDILRNFRLNTILYNELRFIEPMEEKMQTQSQQYVPCPKCGSTNVKKVSYTLWGGALGPALFTHVKCQSCGTQYNGKTGQSNQRNIIIYTLVSFLLVFCACGGFALLSSLSRN